MLPRKYENDSEISVTGMCLLLPWVSCHHLPSAVVLVNIPSLVLEGGIAMKTHDDNIDHQWVGNQNFCFILLLGFQVHSSLSSPHPC